jgi:iron complex outermembrane receptor protein
MEDVRTTSQGLWLLAGILVISMGVLGYGATAAAQQQSQDQGAQAQLAGQTTQQEQVIPKGKEEVKEEVSVTGTLIPRPSLEALSPVSTLNVEALTYQGNTRLEDLLISLPQVFSAQNSTVSNGSSGTATVALRNLGTFRTMVLIDGVRAPIAGFGTTSGGADLNFIPAALVKRVDILTGGASATYGADAVAGVVNFILDRDFEGIKAGITGGGFQHNNSDGVAKRINEARGFTVPTGNTWDGGQFDAYAAFGGKFAEGKGHATVYLDYRKEAALLKSARDYTNCSVSALGSNGPACGGSSTNPYGRFLTDDGGDYALAKSPGSQTFVDYNSSYTYNYAPLNYMQRPDQRYAAGGFINYKWNKHFQGYATVMFMDDRTDAQIAPSGDFGNTLYTNCDNPLLSADQYQKICTNGGYGVGLPSPVGDTFAATGDAGVQILRRNVEGGNRTDLLSHQEWLFVGGLKGEIGNGWSYDIYGQRGESRIPEAYINDLNITRLQQSLFVIDDPNNPGQAICRDATAVSQGCVPWNIWKVGGVTPAALNYLSLPELTNADIVSQSVNGKVTADLTQSGVVFPSAVEGVQLALGTSYRKESLDFEPDLANQMGWGAGSGAVILPVRGAYDVKEAYVEAAIPIVQGARGAQDLKLDLGYRYSDYSSTGGWNTWKADGEWAPAADLKFRAGVNRATRSPNVNELYAPVALQLGGSYDPCTGTSPDFTLEQCERTGVTPAQYGTIIENPAEQYNTLQGGTPTLKPEIADTVTYGVVITPQAMPGFNVTLDYYQIKIKDTIGVLNADDIVTECGLTGNSYLCGLIHRDQFGSLWRTPNGYTVSVEQQVGNRKTEGVDVTAGYTVPSGNSLFSFNLIGTYLMKSELDTALYSYDCVGYYGNKCNNPYSDHGAITPKWRHLFRATWETGNLSLSMGWRFIGSVTAEEASGQASLAGSASKIAQLKANHAYQIPTYNYIDLAMSYKLKAGVQFTLGVNNIADKEPPLGSGSSTNDYSPGFISTYDAYGRYVHSTVTFTF